MGVILHRTLLQTHLISHVIALGYNLPTHVGVHEVRHLRARHQLLGAGIDTLPQVRLGHLLLLVLP